MQISILAVIIIGVLSMALGFVWYGPLFGKPWMKEVGFTEEDIKNGPGVGYLFTFIAAMVMGAVTSLLVHLFNITALADGAAFGALVAIGYIGTSFATNYIFTDKSLRLYLIDFGYQGLFVVLASIVATLVR